LKPTPDEYRGFVIAQEAKSQVRVPQLTRFGLDAAWNSSEAAEIAIDGVLDGERGFPKRAEMVTVCSSPYAFYPEERDAANGLAGVRVRVVEVGTRRDGPSILNSSAQAVRIRGPRREEHWISLRSIRRAPSVRSFGDAIVPGHEHWVRVGPHDRSEARRCDGALVRYRESPETRPWLARALLWIAFEPDPSERYLSYPRGRNRQLGSPRRWVRPERAIAAVDKEYPVRCRCAPR
jgi:hypothetical protein